MLFNRHFFSRHSDIITVFVSEGRTDILGRLRRVVGLVESLLKR